MIYLIKFIFFLSICNYSFANESKTNQILFKINNKVFTNIDLEKRREYIALVNNLETSEISNSENKEIYDDYISSLIFYEFYIKNKIVYQDLDQEIDLIYKKNFQNLDELEESQIKNYKFNTNIDLIRKKIIDDLLSRPIRREK